MGKPRTVIIVGGVAGGMSAATRLRRLDETAEITVFERGPYVSFANCGLPYYVGGVISNRDALLVQTPASLANRFRLDVHSRHEVVAIDAAAHTVSVRDLVAGTSDDHHYDQLILAGGAVMSNSFDHESIPTFTLRSVDDVDHITATLAHLTGQITAVVIGGGFIGVEAVENLARRGITVVLAQRGSHVLSPLDPEMAQLIHERLDAEGIDVRTNVTVIGSIGGVVMFSDGSSVVADLVIDASGVHPDSALARHAGLRIGESGGIWVDDNQRTSDPAIYAVGDGTEKTDAVDGTGVLVTMAGLANRHGRAAADSIAGIPVVAAPALGTSIVSLFGLTIAMTGWSEKRLVSAGRPHRVIHSHPASHASYFPGAEMMHMKLLIDPTTDRILGAQIVGGDGVDKRIDVLATAMSAGIAASALTRLELAYAPQYGSAKDPINQLGYIADNVATGMTATIQWHELDAALQSGSVLVDVRSRGEYRAGGIPGSINVPLDDLRERLTELPDAPIVVHCQVGQRGHTAARILRQHGVAASNLDGGYLTWRAGTASRTSIYPSLVA
jgi:NADPH-dependent 2,4-dienoyl-CoA reductase/sulfur reductase-like enzyme/rhodanese-related sulfurtransferase